jgi:tetratricopeptide (TPR) repeat protein
MGAADSARDRARNLFVLGRLDQAREAAAEVLSSDGSDAGALRLLAQIEGAAGDLDLARTHAQAAVGADQSALSFLVLASVERRSGDYAAAITACEAGLDRDPARADLHSTMSLAWSGPWLSEQPARLSDRQRQAAETAERLARDSLELDPEHALGWYALAVAKLVHNDPFAAATAMSDGLALHPDWAEGHLLMSSIRGRQGMVKLASRHLATAGRLSPGDDAPVRRLRAVAGRAGFRGRRANTSAWWLAPEARAILEADARLGGGRA